MFDKREIEKDLSRIRSDLFDKKVKLAEVRRTNKEHLELQEESRKLNELKNKATAYATAMKYIYKLTSREENAYKKSKLEFLEVNLDEKIHIIFPDIGYRSRLDYDFMYSNSIAELILIDSDGNERMPMYTEGGLMKQLIGFTAAMSTVQCMGANKIYIDEAFAASSEDNKPKLAEIISSYLDGNVQIFLISQSDKLFRDIPRRQFKFERDTDEVEIEDY